jgi:hypothetical protein
LVVIASSAFFTELSLVQLQRYVTRRPRDDDPSRVRASQAPTLDGPLMNATGSRRASVSSKATELGAYSVPGPLAAVMEPALNVKAVPSGVQVVALVATSAYMVEVPSERQVAAFNEVTVPLDMMLGHANEAPNDDSFAFWFNEIMMLL